MLFDKTGTLTYGVPQVTRVLVLWGVKDPLRRILALVGSAEACSEHPLGLAMARHCRQVLKTLTINPVLTFDPVLTSDLVIFGCIVLEIQVLYFQEYQLLILDAKKWHQLKTHHAKDKIKQTNKTYVSRNRQ